MLKIRLSAYIGMLCVLIVSLFGCDSAKKDETAGKVVSLTEVLKSNLSNVDGINVQFGDGNKMEITDTTMIRDIVSQIKSIKVRETASKGGVGFLYFLNLKEGNKTYRMDSNLVIEGKAYEAVDNDVTKLNELILKMGRDRIPELLPGAGI